MLIPGSLRFTAQTRSWTGGNRPDSLRPLPALWAAPSSLLQLGRSAALVLCHFRHREPPAAAEPAAPAASSLCARAPSVGDNLRPQRPSAERTEPAKACGRLGTRQRRRRQRGAGPGAGQAGQPLAPSLQVEKLGGGAQSALILSRICEGGSRRGHEHPQNAPGQGSTEGRGGGQRASARGSSRPSQTSPRRHRVGGQSAGSGGRRDAKGGLRSPRVSPGPQPHDSPLQVTQARARTHTHHYEPWRDRYPERSGPKRVPTTPRSAVPAPPHTPERCVHTQTAGRGRRRLTPRVGMHTVPPATPPLYTPQPPLCSHLPPNPNPENSTKPNSQRRPQEGLRLPTVI